MVIERDLKTPSGAGSALAHVRDRRLYLPAYSTFKDYCRERWRLSRIHVKQLIESATDRPFTVGPFVASGRARYNSGPGTPSFAIDLPIHLCRLTC
jgi:hypothetical protein